MSWSIYVDIDQGIYEGKLKNALNEKRKKLFGFSYSKNMANFEAYRCGQTRAVDMSKMASQNQKSGFA